MGLLPPIQKKWRIFNCELDDLKLYCPAIEMFSNIGQQFPIAVDQQPDKIKLISNL